MKVNITAPLAWMAGVAVAGVVVLVLGLAILADWQQGSIVGMVGAFGTTLVNLVLLARGQQKTTETLAAADAKIDTVIEQTNGASELERQAIAERAVAAVLARVAAGQPLDGGA